LAAGLAGALAAGPARADETLAAMADELGATFRALSAQPEPPYFASWAMVEHRSRSIQATHGALAGVDHDHWRRGDIDIRVGSMQLDNTHEVRDASWFSMPHRKPVMAPLSGDAAPLRALFARASDEVFRQARGQLVQVRANEAVKVARQDTSDDFSPAPPARVVSPAPTLAIDEAAWTTHLREASRVYLSSPAVLDSAARLEWTTDSRWLVTSEGTAILDHRPHLRVSTWGRAVADDGMSLEVYDYVDAATPEKLPTPEKLVAMSRGVADRLTALRAAPAAEPWTGPAILGGRAAGVFFHEIFGHRVEGHRQKDESEGQTFRSYVGRPVLPEFLDVVDDPNQATLGAIDLNGHYLHDAEGVPAERVTLVDHGVLRGFLMSRSPVEGFSRSNGHGRAQPGRAAVARQANLRVEARGMVGSERLRDRLRAEAKAQGRTFGMYFDDIAGGFTLTGRSLPNSFVVKPVGAWRVYVDGRPDELVRGVDMVGTPLQSFALITAAAEPVEVFNGVCGAESGWVPVSASAPALLVKTVEIQRREKAHDRPPILPAPAP
jgi:hypothetical protein